MSARAGTRRKGTATHAMAGAWMLFWSYAPAVAAIALYAARPHAWTFAIAFVVVAARQHALFVVAHEAWHKNLFPWAWLNEAGGSWLATFPIVQPYWAGRASHLEHHRTVGTDADPDRHAWGWRMSDRAAFVRNLLAVATGVPFVVRTARQILRLPPGPPSPGRAPRVAFSPPEGRFDIVKVAMTHVAILGAFHATVGWPLYFLLWLLPAISLRMALDELRQFLEHRNGRLIIYRTGPMERFVLGAFNFHLHAFHHAVASEPWFRLPANELRARRKEPDILEFRSYVLELALYLRGRDSTAAATTAPEVAEERASSSTAP